MKRNWISVLLLLALTLALLPTALADDATELTQENISSNMKLATGSYKLMDDISLSGVLNIGTVNPYGPATVTLDLNGHTLTGADEFNYALWINQYSELTIIDSSKTGSGKVISQNGTAVMIDANASFTLKSGEISNGVAVGGGVYSNIPSTLTMDGGRVTGGVNVTDNSKMELKAGTVDGIQLKNSACTLYANGGTVTGPSEFYGTVLRSENATGTTVFDGVVVNATGKEIPGTLNGGTVTGNGYQSPFLISNAAGLRWFRDHVNSATSANAHNKVSATLMNDIELDANENWEPIGIGKDEYNQSLPYSGTFDGGGHTISSLNVSDDFDYAGLFGVVTGGTIKNLTVAGSVKGSAADDSVAGGIAGKATGSTIEACANLCSVSANQYVGGIVGMIHNTTVRDCYNVGTVTGGSNAGGIVGMAAPQSSNTIANCYNIGNVSASGSVSASGNACGILGYAGQVNVSNCYYL